MKMGIKQFALLVPSLRQLHEDRNRHADMVSTLSSELVQLRSENANILAERDRLATQLHNLREMTEALRGLEQADFPVFFRNGRPYFTDKIINGMPRVVAVTIPKSGTYLVAAFLKRLGLVDSGIHLDDDGFTDYRDKTIAEMVSNYREFRKYYPLEASISLLGPGQFAVGHIHYNEKNVLSFGGARVVFVARELRCVMVSMMRWLCRPGRGENLPWKTIENNKQKMVSFLDESGANLIAWFKACSGWQQHRDVAVLKFEDLTGRNGHSIQVHSAFSLASLCGVELSTEEALARLRDVLDKPTKTWSGGGSSLEEYWSDDAEARFHSSGGAELNLQLGYST